MFPRKCKKCRCYVAPHLTHCPRCGKRAQSNVVTKPTKEEKAEARAVADEKVPTIQGKHIHWIPSKVSITLHEAKLTELRKLFEKAQTPRERNTLRSEIRLTKQHLERQHVPLGKKGWTTEIEPGRTSMVTVFISPKHRYVLAERDQPCDLRIIPAKKKVRRTTPVLRLVRYESSEHAQWLKRQKRLEAKDSTRKKRKSKKGKKAIRRRKRK